ncbi:MAG: cytochrome b/b6 domain-containing protein [Deltaproteobacteria bacterium]|nr:cytochrome b/b6 domain-containing protein [Deltaproteobacteria bacterium]
MTNIPDTTKFKRFEKTEILLHWSHGLPFLFLVLTGFWLAWDGMTGIERSESISYYHKIAGIVLIFLPPVVVISGNLELIIRNFRKIISFGPADVSWIKSQSNKQEPLAQGKFNFGQKMNTLAVMVYSSFLQLTGIWLWITPQGLLPRWLHTIVAFGGSFLLCGHLYMAMVNPSTRKAFMAVITGFVSKDYIRHHHELQLDDAEDADDRGFDLRRDK